MASINIGIPDSVLSLIQTGLLERAFHDALYPALQYRSEAQVEEWEGNIGTEIFFTRAGLLPPNTTPLVAGKDPTPKSVPYEQWIARLQRFGDTVDIHMPTAAVANADLFVRTIQQLGLQAGQSVNRLARNTMFQGYLSGQSVLIAATAAPDLSIRVASLNGFTSVVLPGVRPVAVSPSTPLAIQIGTGAAAITRNVISFTQDDPNDALGPGTLIISVAVGAIFAVRSPVLSSVRPKVIRSGGGDSVDALSPSDTFVLQDAINAVAQLRKNNVMPHEDGYYHAHISADGNAQVFADPVWQRLHTALPEGMTYKEGFIGTIGQVAYFLNTESPESSTVSLAKTSGASAFAKYASDLGAETVNDSGVGVGRILVTGRGVLYEKRFDEMKYISEAGVQGKLGEFSIVNNGLTVSTEGIRLYLRAPQDRLGDIVAATWSISTSFPLPTDLLAGAQDQLLRRAIIIEHGLG